MSTWEQSFGQLETPLERAMRARGTHLAEMHADLQFVVPENVTIRCAYFEHGEPGLESETSNQALRAHWLRMAAAVRGSVWVGVEIGRAEDPTVNVKQYFKRLTLALRQGGTIPYDSVALPLQALAEDCIEHGEAVPDFHPIDAYDTPELHRAPIARHASLPSIVLLTRDTLGLRERDSLVLRQAMESAGRLGRRTMKPVVMTLLQGSQHTPVSYALQNLGANVERFQIDPPEHSPAARLQDRIYMNGPEAVTDADIQEVTSALALGQTMYNIGGGDQALAQPIPWLRSLERHRLMNRLSMAIYAPEERPPAFDPFVLQFLHAVRYGDTTMAQFCSQQLVRLAHRMDTSS